MDKGVCEEIMKRRVACATEHVKCDPAERWKPLPRLDAAILVSTQTFTMSLHGYHVIEPAHIIHRFRPYGDCMGELGAYRMVVMGSYGKRYKTM